MELEKDSRDLHSMGGPAVRTCKKAHGLGRAVVHLLVTIDETNFFGDGSGPGPNRKSKVTWISSINLGKRKIVSVRKSRAFIFLLVSSSRIARLLALFVL